MDRTAPFRTRNGSSIRIDLRSSVKSRHEAHFSWSGKLIVTVDLAVTMEPLINGPDKASTVTDSGAH